MSIINVDKRKKDDVHYRYKMPSLEIKVESAGNGVKVVFNTISDVAEALNRPVESLLKFLGVAKGAQTTFDAKDNKFFMMGYHIQSELQDCVFEFIEKFVLCKWCRNPETSVRVVKKSVCLRCGACGKDTSMDAQDDRIVRELVKGANQTQSETVRADTAATASAAAPSAVEREAECLIDLTQAFGEAAAVKNPSDLLAEALKDTTNIGKIGVQKRVISLKAEFNVSEEDMPRLIFRGATDASIDGGLGFIAPLRDATFLFKNLLDSCRAAADKVAAIQDTILSEIALRVINRGKAEKTAMVLKMLVDESILEPAKVIAFCKGIETNPQVRKKDALPIVVQTVAPLVSWLEEGTGKDSAAEEAAAAAPVETEAAPEKVKKSKRIDM